MKSSTGPNHVVVDGSNIATEGRSLPSLAQLSEAVMAFMEDYPNTSITVVVDATFGHRIDKKEVAEFEEGIANNELVAPPAGAVGRGDAFVLSIAQKAHSAILSNDSFQEFHGDYEWLFDEGRLIGGKPVPHVGWVFVDRTPVRGPVSRKATGGKGGGRRKSQGESKSEPSRRGGRKTSAEAMEPMPVPKSPPPRRAAPAAAKSEVEPTRAREKSSSRNSGREQSSPPKAGDTVNDLMPFLEFVEHHPVGTNVEGTVDSYSSHGAYIAIGDDGVRGYVPLRLMANPTPTSARKVMKLGDSVKLVVVSFAPVRRSIDCAVPDLAAAAIADARAEQDADADTDTDAVIEAAEVAASDETPTKLSGSAAKKPAAKKAPAKKSPAKKAAAAKKPAGTKASAKKSVAKQAPAKKVPAAKVPAKTVPAKTVPAKTVPAKHAPASKAPAKKVPATKAPAAKVSAKKVPAKKAPAKKVPADQVPAKKAPAAKVRAKQAPAKKAPASKVSAKKAPVAKAPAKKPAARTAAPSKKATRPAPKGR